MSMFGKGAGRFLRDVQIFYPDALSLRPIAIDILRDREDLSLSLSLAAFVFAVRRKEQFMFFNDVSDNPPVMFYMSGDDQPRKISESFWLLIESELEIAEKIYAEIKGTPYDFYRANPGN